MAAEAAVLAEQGIATHQLGGLVAVFRGDQVGDLVVALEARGFYEALGQHGEFPVVDRLPVVLLGPAFPFWSAVGRVRGEAEIGTAGLAAVTGGAAELLGVVLAVGADKQIK